MCHKRHYCPEAQKICRFWHKKGGAYACRGKNGSCCHEHGKQISNALAKRSIDAPSPAAPADDVKNAGTC
jgi:hypothetical protein